MMKNEISLFSFFFIFHFSWVYIPPNQKWVIQHHPEFPGKVKNRHFTEKGDF